MNLMFFFRAILIVFFIGSDVQAFQIDTLTKVIDKDTQYIEITGEYEREYIYTQLTQLLTDKKHGLREIPFNPEDISSWPIIVEPGEIVLDKADKIRVKIIRNGPQQDEDRVSGLAFIPEKVRRKKIQDSGLQISVGYKVWLFIPGKSPLKGQIKASKKSGNITIENMTNKILRIVPDDCSGKNKSECAGAVILLPYTSKQIDDSEHVQTLSIYLINDLHKKIKVITL